MVDKANYKRFKAKYAGSCAGFTMVEVLVYLALFGLIVGGAVVAAYNVVETGGRNQTQAALQQEGNFLLGKINWALSGISAVNQPQDNQSSSRLLTAKVDLSIGAIDITDDASHTKMVINRGSSTYQLSNDNVVLSNLEFNHHHPSGGADWVVSSFTLSAKTPNGQTISQDFTTTKYLRK